jgi:integrase/recombinase XerD
MIPSTLPPTALGPLLQAFFTEHLMSHRLASRETVDGYRVTFRLLLEFLQRSKGKSPSSLCVSDVDAPAILEFLDYLEKERQNCVRSRNVRLAAIRAFFRMVALRDPASVHHATRVLSIPVKLTDRRLVHYLTRPEMDAVLAAPDRTRPTGQRDYALLLTMYNSGARLRDRVSQATAHPDWPHVISGNPRQRTEGTHGADLGKNRPDAEDLAGNLRAFP